MIPRRPALVELPRHRRVVWRVESEQCGFGGGTAGLGYVANGESVVIVEDRNL